MGCLLLTGNKTFVKGRKGSQYVRGKGKRKREKGDSAFFASVSPSFSPSFSLSLSPPLCSSRVEILGSIMDDELKVISGFTFPSRKKS